MLLERKHSIADITYEVGFKNPSSFSKSFRKQFGRPRLNIFRIWWPDRKPNLCNKKLKGGKICSEYR